MRSLRTCILLVVFIISISVSEVYASGPDNSKPAGAYSSKIYPNLFVELLDKTPSQVQKKIDTAWNLLFYGRENTQRIYFTVDPDMAYILDVGHNDVRSEGMSYGMMIAVQMNKKEEFDRLWKWTKTYMQHKSGPRKNYFAWQLKTDGTVLDENSASDGEEWFVMSLFFAAARWPNGTGIYDYRAEAQVILDEMLNKETVPDNGRQVTSMFNKKEKQIVFCPIGAAADYTDPCYHLPHFYELWARWADKDNQFWYDAAAASRQLFKKAAHPKTGLTPDYTYFDGTPADPANRGHDDFRFDAWRVAMNIAVDYSWFAADEWAVTQSNRLLDFFYSQGIRTYGIEYTLDGTRLSRDHNVGLVAANAVAALASTNENRADFVKALWHAPIPMGTVRYYDGLLYMLGLLQVSGNFKIYEPADNPVSACPQAAPVAKSTSYISKKSADGCFTLSASGKSAPLYASADDYPGVIKVLKHLQTDIDRVTNAEPGLYTDKITESKELVLVGTLGKSPIIDKLVQAKKIDVADIAGRWETFLLQVVDEPLPDVARALVIAGSDKRGTIYGIFDLSKEIGVSPWYWWADVPPKKSSTLYVLPGRYTQGEPAVKYRGIFLNDEEPALGRWAVENYGGFNHQFYEKLFELMLRMKANYLWPAMWWASFNSDDPLNPKLADELGIVVGTTHHEPMNRAHAEWRKSKGGQWNYETNAEKLREFWTEGIQRMGSYESIVTLAMRGDGDKAMSESTNISLLEKIVADQRKILADVTGKDVNSIPQIWALYKEVQDYYDKGMRVPDDVTLLLCDDNWGNIRRLPKPEDPPRSGGYGIYYHFDFVGGPRNYKWLNTSPIPRVWEQMHLAYRHGVDRIWLVNVGDLKPMEFSIEFFLDYAWSPDKWPAERLPRYTRLWAEQQFGPEHAADIADIISKYTKYNGRRKPEMLSPDTYSLAYYREAETIVADYNKLAAKAEKIYNAMPPEYKDAYYQLVLHPVKACANLNELYVTEAKNHLFAKQRRAATNDLADRVKDLFKKDAEISHYYNKILAGGKWNHMMDQTHISYTNWQQPDKDVMPEVKNIEIPEVSDMGVAIEGSDSWWPMAKTEAVLPEFDPFNQQTYYIELFNRCQAPFDYKIVSAESWLTITPNQGKIDKQQRVLLSVDWHKAPTGSTRVPVTINGPEKSGVVVYAPVNNPESPKPDQVTGFVESNGYVSIEAEHYTRAVNAPPIRWQRIPDLGRTLSAMTPFPVTAESQTPQGDSPRLEYCMHLFSSGKVKVKTYLSPTQNFHNTQGLRYAVSFDDQSPQIVNIHRKDTVPDWKYPPAWNQAVSDNIKVMTSVHLIDKPGEHILKYWMVDPGIVLQKIVVETADVKPSYFGPPESFYQAKKSCK